MIYVFVFDKYPAYGRQYGWNVIDSSPYRVSDDPVEVDGILSGLASRSRSLEPEVIEYWKRHTLARCQGVYTKPPPGTVVIACVWDILVDRRVDAVYVQVHGESGFEVRWAVQPADPFVNFRYMHLPEWSLVTGGHLAQFIALSQIG